MFLQQLQPEHQQIVEIHRVGGALARSVALFDVSICGGDRSAK